MDLIERYLGAVRWNLPAGKADDIVAELRDLLASRIEDREEALGRPLARDEVSALLKEFGHPLAVAGQYHDQRALIGSELFPFYWFALRVVLAIVVVIEAVALGIRMVAGEQSLIQAMSHGFGDTVAALLLNGAVVTLVFAVIERAGWLASYLRRWSPESLPTLPQIAAQPRRAWEPLLGIAFGVVFLVWWSGGLPISLIPREADMTVRAGPVWATLYWPVAGLIAAGILRDLTALLAPAWKPLRALLSLGCAAATIAIAAFVYKADPLVIVTKIGAGAEQAARIQDGLDLAFAIAVPVIGALAVWQCAVELWQLYREPR